MFVMFLDYRRESRFERLMLRRAAARVQFPACRMFDNTADTGLKELTRRDLALRQFFPSMGV
jgi:hypothetical protein